MSGRGDGSDDFRRDGGRRQEPRNGHGPRGGPGGNGRSGSGGATRPGATPGGGATGPGSIPTGGAPGRPQTAATPHAAPRGPRPATEDRSGGDPESGRSRRMERIGDLLPRTAREFGLEEQLEQARAASAWDRIVAARVPAAAGACRLAALDRGVVTIEADLPIVAQEIRLRSTELLAALRHTLRTPVVSLQVIVRHV